MRLSRRIETLEASGEDGWTIHYRAREMRAAGRDVISLCVGDHDFAPDPVILDAMHAAARAGQVKYGPVAGMDTLRDLVADRHGATREEVAITSGGQAALFAAICAAIDPGDRVGVIDPFYATYPSTIRAAGGVVVPIPVRSRNGFAPTAQDLAPIRGLKALLVNTPNNPTGAVYGRETLDMIAGYCLENDVILISDEVYASQVWAGAHLAPRNVHGLKQRTITLGSFSKSHAMTGFRIGWVLAPARVIALLRHLANATTYGTPEFIQAGALAALGADDGAQVAAIYRARRDLALRILDEGGMRVIPPQGGMYVMCDIRPTGQSGIAFAERLLTDKGIAVMPGESFGQAAAGHIRIALTQPLDRLETALAALVEFSKEFA